LPFSTVLYNSNQREAQHFNALQLNNDPVHFASPHHQNLNQ